MSLTPQEQELASRIGFDVLVLELLKRETQVSLNQLQGYDDGNWNEMVFLKGVAVAVPTEALESWFPQIQSQLPPGYLAVVVRDRHQNQIAILKTDDPFELLKIRRTEGINYDFDNAAVIATIQAWAERCSFQILLVGHDQALLKFHTLPPDLCAFAEEVYEFCPDTVEQGVALRYVPAENPEVFATACQLCPQLSRNYDNDEEIATSLPSEFAGILALANQMAEQGLNTSTYQGIQLLAYELQTTRRLYLWWD